MEMIAVIVFGQCIYRFFKRQIVYLTKMLYFRNKDFAQLFFRNTTHSRIVIIHADILQLVQITKYADLREFRHSGNEDETQVAVGAFQHAVKGFQGFTVFFQQVVVAKGLQQGFVVFVHQHHDTATGLFAGTADDTGETGGKGVLISTFAI